MELKNLRTEVLAGENGKTSDENHQGDHASQEVKDSVNKQEKWRIVKSVLILAVSMFGVYTAYTALEILQSTINKETGINSIVMLYTTKIVASFLGPLIVSTLTPKWTVFLSFLCHSSFILANLYPVWYILLPAGALVGLSTGPFWISVNLYITVLGFQYANITGAAKATTLSKWNSLVMLTMPMTMITGNFLSSTILQNVRFSDSEGTGNATDLHLFNTSERVDYAKYDNDSSFTAVDNGSSISSSHEYCGANFCPWIARENSIKNLERPDQGAVYLLIGILGLFNLCGVLLTLFGLPNLKQEDLQSEMAVKHSSLCRYVLDYLKLFFNWHFLFLIPSLLYMHFTISLTNALFPRAYLSCFLGVGMVGYVSMTRGVTGFSINLMNGVCGGKINIRVLLLVAFISSTSAALMLLFWQYVHHDTVAAIITAALAGGSISLNLTQGPAFLGAKFDNKVAVFSFYHFISGISVALGYLGNNYLCARQQIYIYLTLICLALPTFISLDIVLRKNAKKKKSEATKISEEKEFIEKLSPSRQRKHQLTGGQDQYLTASQVSLTFS